MIKYLQTHIARFFFLSFFLSCIFLANSSFAQISFSAVCPDKTISKDDYLQIQFMVENAPDVETIIPPSFKNFSIASGPNQQSGMSNINGKVDQYVAISFYLKPNGPGKYVIGPAIARVNGKEYRTNPVAVTVTNTPGASQSNSGPASPFGNMTFDFPTEPTTHRFDDYILKKGENVHDKVQKNLFIKLDINKTSCYVGQPIVASYKLYTRLRSESVVTSAPSFNGFSVSELEVNDVNSASVEKYNGRDYNVYTLRKVQLYPLQTGTFTLDPVVADNKVTFLKSEYAGSQQADMFYDMLQNFANATSPQNSVVEEHVTLQSKPVEITVKPMPEENKPADFKGAVGNFRLSSSLEKNNITTDDAGNLKVSLEGIGNIQLINSPKVTWPAGIDGYDPKVTDNIDKFSVPIKGTKTFTFPFTASAAGHYTIPAFSFSYFNPSTEQYKTLHTQPVTVNVTKGKGNSQNRFVKNINGTSDQRESGLTKYVLLLLVAAAFIALFIFISVRRKTVEDKKKNFLQAAMQQQAEASKESKEPEFVIPDNPLLEAHGKLMEENQNEFYGVLDCSLKNYLAGKFKVPIEELTKKRINEELDKCNVSLGTSLMLNSLLDEVELNVYAPPSSTTHLKNVYEKASEVLALLDKQVC